MRSFTLKVLRACIMLGMKKTKIPFVWQPCNLSGKTNTKQCIWQRWCWCWGESTEGGRRCGAGSFRRRRQGRTHWEGDVRMTSTEVSTSAKGILEKVEWECAWPIRSIAHELEGGQRLLVALLAGHWWRRKLIKHARWSYHCSAPKHMEVWCGICRCSKLRDDKTNFLSLDTPTYIWMKGSGSTGEHRNRENLTQHTRKSSSYPSTTEKFPFLCVHFFIGTMWIISPCGYYGAGWMHIKCWATFRTYFNLLILWGWY